MSDQAECGICFEEYDEASGRSPKLLPCLHTVCLACLKQLVKRGKIQCPFDRAIYKLTKYAKEVGLDDLPTNQVVLKETVVGENKKVLTLCKGEIEKALCELHGKPLTHSSKSKMKICHTCKDSDLSDVYIPAPDYDMDDEIIKTYRTHVTPFSTKVYAKRELKDHCKQLGKPFTRDLHTTPGY